MISRQADPFAPLADQLALPEELKPHPIQGGLAIALWPPKLGVFHAQLDLPALKAGRLLQLKNGVAALPDQRHLIAKGEGVVRDEAVAAEQLRLVAAGRPPHPLGGQV